MQLKLVEDAGSERELRHRGAVDQDVLVARDLFGARPDNVFLVKAAYWMGR